MDRHAAEAAGAGDQQQQEEQVGWQDTDSEGMALHQADTAEDAAALQDLLQQTTELTEVAAAAAGAATGGRRRARSSGSGDGSSGSSLQETEEAEEPAEGCTRFDPNVTASHQYLGDVDELEGGYGHLQEGTTARLPLLMLDGVVLFPGCQLPLLLSTPAEQRLLERALAAPPPLTRLLAVLPGPRSWLASLPRSVACTAEVRQMRRSSGEEGGGAGPVAVLALGRQRAEVLHEPLVARSQSSVLVRILSEGCQADVPQPMRGYLSPIHPALTAPWDLTLLSRRVRELIQLVLMPVASFQGSPLELSYHVSHNLPLQPSTRQLLLTAACPAERLRLLLSLLQRLDQLRCSGCGALLATTADVLGMTSEGISGTFVNSHGYVHEMVAFKHVHRVQLEGQPETAHSWFPGYAWTIAYCGTCGQHLGWRFTAVEPGLSPRLFWGIRRQVLTCSTRQGPREQQQQQQDGGGGLGPGGVLAIQLGNMPVGAGGEHGGVADG
ncbi:hypothetical protein OEZ85_010415 [Tetradesmus obliquus]|uniref:Protein cereblon n=1 Tax=Tetradesmus obliquus TaxID=3088 RepID=A0ABY8TM76_TETOB|nr:hypothetical protein OEZ85_010415 [Tetradesmus obliquus]